MVWLGCLGDLAGFCSTHFPFCNSACLNFVLAVVAKLGNCGVISVLFETPSGFALFGYDGLKLFKPDAINVLWLFQLLCFTFVCYLCH